MRKILISLAVIIMLLILVASFLRYGDGISRAVLQQLSGVSIPLSNDTQTVRVVTEESITIDIVDRVGPAVVTVVATSTGPRNFRLGPFFFEDDQADTQPQDIGSGFIVSSDGLVVTNRHVVSQSNTRYQVITANETTYDVERIYRDPVNDIAILKINPSQHAANQLTVAQLGDSSRLRVGQFVVAIGTALGEFRNTVTTGVVSGLGRGILAGDAFQQYTQRLEDVIQTSAPINPGNSGGPLVNSNGEVIGINTAVASEGQNIGFALPINTVKESINTFNTTGQFDRPFLGVSQRFIPQRIALLNDVPSGTYIQSVVPGSPADRAGLQEGDIVISIDGQRIDDGDNTLPSIIARKRINDTVSISYWRDGQTRETRATLTLAPQQ